MKKAILSLGLMAIAGSMISLQSCNKVKDAVLKNINPFDFSMQSFVVNVDPTPSGMDSLNTGAVSTKLNLQDSINKYIPSGLSLSLNDVKEVRLKTVTVSPETGFTGGSTGNNFTNISDVAALFNSNVGASAGLQNIGQWLNIPQSSEREMQPLVFDYSSNPVNLKNYFNTSGETEIRYFLRGKLRRAVTAPLQVRVTVQYTIVP
ncbi:MAG: hypothetical protein JSS78_02710 [Bacteroidetes bacterium]|nr:hypothetical protein [Bacteroidota bacterium]